MVAAGELAALDNLLAQVALSDEVDQRLAPSSPDPEVLQLAWLYRLRSATGRACHNWQFVWCNVAPHRVKLFAWLLTNDRLSCTPKQTYSGSLWLTTAPEKRIVITNFSVATS